MGENRKCKTCGAELQYVIPRSLPIDESGKVHDGARCLEVQNAAAKGDVRIAELEAERDEAVKVGLDWCRQTQVALGLLEQEEVKNAKLQVIVDKLLDRLGAVESLLVCYRVGKHPSEKLLARLDATREAVEAAKGKEGGTNVE